MKCPEKDNVCEFLDSLCVKREELATVGINIDTKDYLSTIISSLPMSLSNFASNQLAATKLYAPMKTIDPDALISLISEEYERQKAQHSHRSTGKSPKEDDCNEAMSASSSRGGSSRGGKAGGRNHKFTCGTCWGCGEEGHFRDKCPTKPQKSKDRKDSKGSQKSGSANAAVGVDSDSEGESAFATVAINGYDLDGSMPGLEAVSDSDSNNESENGSAPESDWFYEVVNERGSDCASSEGSDWDCDDLFKDSMPAINVLFALEDPGNPELAAAFISADDNEVNAPCTEVYDSGCTSHISPY